MGLLSYDSNIGINFDRYYDICELLLIRNEIYISKIFLLISVLKPRINAVETIITEMLKAIATIAILMIRRENDF